SAHVFGWFRSGNPGKRHHIPDRPHLSDSGRPAASETGRKRGTHLSLCVADDAHFERSSDWLFVLMIFTTHPTTHSLNKSLHPANSQSFPAQPTANTASRPRSRTSNQNP